MGYQSHYTLSLEPQPDPVVLHAFAYALGQQSGYSFEPGSDGKVRNGDQCSWYEFKSDIVIVSRNLPCTTILVERVGEQSPDLERVYVRNGEHASQTPEIVWPAKPEGF